MVDVSVVLPTYNEKENIERLIDTILKVVGRPTEVIVVDDDSPDGTWKIVEKISSSNKNVKLLRRIKKRGLASALSEGISLSKGGIIVWMDCDFSHPPELMPQLVDALDKNDVAIASRYVKGGKDLRPFGRVLTSMLFNLYASILLGFSIRDYTTGFVAAKREVMDEIRLYERGHGGYCVDFLYRSQKKFKIKEVPYEFKDREKGETKTSPNIFQLIRHGWEYGILVLKIRLGHTTK